MIKSEQAGGKASTQSVLFVHIKRSFIPARVLISTFNGFALSSRMACWVCTLMVKVPLLHQTKHAVPSKWWHEQQHSVPFASCWDFQWSAQAALEGIADVQVPATIFQLIVDYLIAPASFYKNFQLVVKSISILDSEGAQLKFIVVSRTFKISFPFQEECRIFREGE
jgi:hypothetical protein